MLLSIPFAVLFGWLYGLLLNRVKGEEMTIAMYVGFAMVMLMSILWLILPYSSENMVWGYAGKGLRTTITLDGFWNKQLSNFLAIKIGENFTFPTGMILFVALCCVIMWVFMRSKTGTAMTHSKKRRLLFTAVRSQISRMDATALTPPNVHLRSVTTLLQKLVSQPTLAQKSSSTLSAAQPVLSQMQPL